MNNSEFYGIVKKRGLNILCNEPMSRHTTFKTGGEADFFVSVKNADELVFAINAAKNSGVPYFVCGRGSDLLVSDRGVEGAVISLSGMKKITVFSENVSCEAGCSVQTLCLSLQKAGLSGLEFAYGIPGSIGGAVYMNAGAYGGEIKDCIVSAKYLDKNGVIKEISREDMGLGYRSSIFQSNGAVILSADFKFRKADPSAILEKMNGYLSRRKEKQPLEFPSAGSVFKRPEGNFAGTLIEKSGLKGVRIGGAQVSEKHAGFIVNKGGATSADVKALIEKVRETVYADSGINLEPEIIFAGRWEE